MATTKDLIVDNDMTVLGNLYTGEVSYAYGTCNTAAGTAIKEIKTISPWNPKKGSLIVINSTYTNTATSPKFKINNKITGSIEYGGSIITSTNLNKAGTQNKPCLYYYNGSTFCWIEWPVDSNFSGSLSTVASTGNYFDLNPHPEGVLTIQQNGGNTKTFSSSSTGEISMNFSVPTKMSDLTNNNFIKQVHTYSNFINNTAGSATLSSCSGIRQGNFAEISLTFHTTSTTNVGSTVFSCNVTEDALKPWDPVRGYGYNGKVGYLAKLDTDGSISVDVLNTQSATNKDVTLSFTYMVRYRPDAD